MGRRSRALLLLLCALGGVPADRAAGAEEEEEEAKELRQRLTEREDERRPVKPWSVLVGGRPLTLSGEYELELGYLRRPFAEDGERDDRLLLEHDLEAERFYGSGKPLFGDERGSWSLGGFAVRVAF